MRGNNPQNNQQDNPQENLLYGDNNWKILCRSTGVSALIGFVMKALGQATEYIIVGMFTAFCLCNCLSISLLPRMRQPRQNQEGQPGVAPGNVDANPIGAQQVNAVAGVAKP